MAKGLIYLITNLINNKKYVGKTTQSLQERWQQHKSCIHNNNINYTLYKSMRKYGIEYFDISIIEDNIDVTILSEREKYWIKELDTYITDNKGYNCTFGGEGYSTIDADRAIELWENEKLGINEIANILNCDRSSLRKIIKRLDSYSELEARLRGNNGNKANSLINYSDNNKEINHIIPCRNIYNNHTVFQYDKYGNFIEEFDNMYVAQEKTGVNSKNIYIWQ